MNLYSSSKVEHMQQATLDLLHAEALDWLEELDFCKEELSFFSGFLQQLAENKGYAKKEVAELGLELSHIMHPKLEGLLLEVQRHTHSLEVLSNKSFPSEDETYKVRHQVLFRKMHNMHSLIRNFKKNLYLFIRKQAHLSS